MWDKMTWIRNFGGDVTDNVIAKRYTGYPQYYYTFVRTSGGALIDSPPNWWVFSSRTIDA